MKNLTFWLRFSVINFLLVAILGVLMRYKIAFSMPFLEQKHAQEAHSHFAFYGWIAQILYTFIAQHLSEHCSEKRKKQFNFLLILNAICAYLMIPAFLWKGYFAGSILVSTLCLFISYAFFILCYKEFRGRKDLAKPWYVASLFFSTMSSIGIFSLAYMMATKNIIQDLYLSSTYFYLHFQYNGFFMFACFGLLISTLQKAGAKISEQDDKRIFWLMFVGCVLGFGLSMLWSKLPLVLFVLVILGTMAQTLGAFKIFKLVKSNWTHLVLSWSPMQRFVLYYVGFAFFVKIILQLFSNIPAISQFAFGYRNVVIAYLHLVLLMCISVFLLSQILATNKFQITKTVLNALKIILLGIFLNEVVLGIIGVFSIKYISIPYSAELLVVISVLIAIGLLMMISSLKARREV